MDVNLIQPAWYVLYTASRCEKKVAKDLEDKGVQFYLPLHASPRLWSDRVKIVELPLFPSYIFVHCPWSQIYSLLQIKHVAHLVRIGSEAAVVREKEIADIGRFLELAKNCPLCEGDEVRLICGKLKNLKGSVKKIGKKKLILYVESLHAQVCVSLDQVVKNKEVDLRND
ncbi:MAG: UpxY family transcription antiterminator [Bacteroidales bacterium]